MKLNKKLLIALPFLFCIIIANAQTVTDTIQSNDLIIENLDEEDAGSSALDTINHALPVFDRSAVPAAFIYNSWDNIFVNPYGIDLVKKPDTTIIDLVNYNYPIKTRITSDFGWRRWQWHYGVDLKLNIGDTIYSSFEGMVRVAKRSRTFGNYIVIRHTNGLETVYGHMSKLLVVCNQRVKAGEVIGLGGNTGRSTGPHLHYEVRFLGNCINPHDILNFKDFSIQKDTLLLCQDNFNYISEIRKIRFHKVRKGDTLGKISRKYGVSINSLCKLNHIRKTTLLRIGRRLRYT